MPAGSRCKRRLEPLVAPNITPDRDTGIGNWTDDEFLAALHEGRGRNGTRLYPAMPYPAYTKMTDADVLAIRAYLATVAPVHNIVDCEPVAVSAQHPLLAGILEFVEFHAGPLSSPIRRNRLNGTAAPISSKVAAHCGTCHTPKTFLGGDKSDAPLAGATLQGWFAPNITTDSHTGIGGWSKDDLAQYLKTGTNTWTLASGPMAEAVIHSTSQDDRCRPHRYLDLSEGQWRRVTPRQSLPPLPLMTARCAPARRSTKTVARPVTGIPVKARSISFRGSPGPRWCNPTTPPRLPQRASCRARGRCPPPPSQPRPRCRRSTGGSMTTRRPPFYQRTSQEQLGKHGVADIGRIGLQARVRHWRALPDVCRLQGPPIVR